MMWRERIQAARERGGFSRQDKIDAGTHECKDQPYAHCAVGEQADRYGWKLIFMYPGRYGVWDQRLRELGGEFAGAVSVNDFRKAEQALDAIEDRALELKRSRVAE